MARGWQKDKDNQKYFTHRASVISAVTQRVPAAACRKPTRRVHLAVQGLENVGALAANALLLLLASLAPPMQPQFVRVFQLGNPEQTPVSTRHDTTRHDTTRTSVTHEGHMCHTHATTPHACNASLAMSTRSAAKLRAAGAADCPAFMTASPVPSRRHPTRSDAARTHRHRHYLRHTYRAVSQSQLCPPNFRGA